jgi:hypothetical protein
LNDLLEHITESLKIALQFGAKEESAQVLWAVLSVMGGLAFHKRPPVKKALAVSWIDRETVLEDPVFQSGAALGNPVLMDLADTLDVWTGKRQGRA